MHLETKTQGLKHTTPASGTQTTNREEAATAYRKIESHEACLTNNATTYGA